MSTRFLAGATIQATGLFQTKSYTEGDSTVLLDPMIFFTTSYGGIITATLSFAGDKVDQIDMRSNNLNAPIVKADANTWTISSSVHQEVTDTISSLYIVFLNSDVDSQFSITTTIDNEVNSQQGEIIITGSAVADAININQTNTVNEDTQGFNFGNNGQGAPAVQDQLGAGSGRTYRITFSPAPGSEGLYYIYSNHPIFGGVIYSNTVTFEGDQDTCNDVMAGIGTAFHFDNVEDNTTPYTILYTQEVIDGAPGVPYVQETGVFNFNVNAIPNFIVNGPFTYDEDTILSFVPGQVNEIDIGRTYKVTLTVSDNGNPGEFDNPWVNEGAGVFTFIGNKDECNTALDTNFITSADYNSDFTVNFGLINNDNGLDKGNEDIAMNIGNVDADSGFTVNVGPYDWTANSNTGLPNFSTITDSRGDNFPNINYVVEIFLDAPASDANGELRTFGTGGFSYWDVPNNKLYLDGTKEELNSHLDSMEWWSRGPTDAFTMVAFCYRNINSEGNVLLNSQNNITMNTGQVLPSPSNTNINRVYDEDVKTNFNDEDKT